MLDMSLAEFFGVEQVDFQLVQPRAIIRSTAHVIIDAQREFADPKHKSGRGNPETDRISEHISRITPEFSDIGLKTYWVYYTTCKKRQPNPRYREFHRNTPRTKHELVPKRRDSAFQGSNIGRRLKHSGVSRIILSGFNASACVYETALGGLSRGFSVCVLADAIANDVPNSRHDIDRDIMELKRLGATISESRHVINTLNLKKKITPASP